jgi:hypothetical protein
LKNKNEYVILLHGMGRISRSMNDIETALLKEGYRVINVGYPSTRKLVPALIKNYIKPELLKLKSEAASKIHFVTHSLGGILVRALLQTESLPKGSRIVMLSPPNHGSEIVDHYKFSWWYKAINGPAGQVLGTEKTSLPNQLKPIDAEVGVITGNKSYEPWFSRIIPGADDGKVSVESAKLDEMKDFLVVNSGHTLIMKDPKVIHQIKYFLLNAIFQHN